LQKILLFFLENLFSLKNVQDNTKWKQFGLTVAGGNREGNQLNQLASPLGIYVNGYPEWCSPDNCSRDICSPDICSPVTVAPQTLAPATLAPQ
jgi:hypothetical protein